MTAPLSVAPRHPGPARGRRLGRGALAAALVLLLGGAWLLWDNLRLDVSSYEVAVADAPDGEVLRLAHVSDLHAADHHGSQDAMVREVDARGVDLVALTGDLIDRRTRDLAPVLDLAARLQAIAPTYVVLGNHEADSPLRQELLAQYGGHGADVVLSGHAHPVRVNDPRELVLVDLVRGADAR